MGISGKRLLNKNAKAVDSITIAVYNLIVQIKHNAAKWLNRRRRVAF